MKRLLPLMKGPSARWRTVCAATLTAGVASAAGAVDWNLSGFGTVGYAVSDRSYHYQRFIDDHGTFERDSVLGAQADVSFNSEWSATLQGTLKPAEDDDERWALNTSWAFVSWRPTNEWQVRVGKQRIPIYLNAENLDVGQTYDYVRLPTEMYAMSPTFDMTGLYVSHSWFPDIGELSLEVLGGQARLSPRVYTRDTGVDFLRVKTNMLSAVLTLRADHATWRLGLHHAVTRKRSGDDLVTHFPYVDTGYGYYQVSNALPGPGVGTSASIANDVIVAGGDVEVAPNWRVVGEIARNVQSRTDFGANTAGAYLAVLHKMGRFTPYVSVARLRSLGRSVETVDGLDAVEVPSYVPGADQLNASQRAAADAVPMYDQSSLALGTSFALTPRSKLKAEWLRTHIGKRSALVDSPAGGEVVRHQDIQVLSLNYSFVF